MWTSLNTLIQDTSTKNVEYSFDINPIADRSDAASLRVAATSGTNLAVNSSNGLVTSQSSIADGLKGVAYNDSYTAQSGAPDDISLYYINSEIDRLAVALTGFGKYYYVQLVLAFLSSLTNG